MTIQFGAVLFPTNGGAGAPGAESDRLPFTQLFGLSSNGLYSHNVHVDAHGSIFHAFGLTGDDTLTVQMVVGCKDGDLFEDLCIGGRRLQLGTAPCNNLLVIPFPGRFRLAYAGANLGGFHAFHYPVPYAAFPALGPFIERFMGAA